MKTEIKALIGVINFLVKSGRLSIDESDCLIKTTKDIAQALQIHDTKKVRKLIVKITKTITKIIT